MIDKNDDDTLDWGDEEDIHELNFDEEPNWSICNLCGTENDEDDVFCGECGTRLQGDPDD